MVSIINGLFVQYNEYIHYIMDHQPQEYELHNNPKGLKLLHIVIIIITAKFKVLKNRIECINKHDIFVTNDKICLVTLFTYFIIDYASTLIIIAIVTHGSIGKSII